MDNFKPSSQQLDIFNEIEGGSCNIVIEAAAGSGKTTTIVKAIEHIGVGNRTLVIAFNRDIVGELSSRLDGQPNVVVRTLHSLGLATVKRCLKNYNVTVNEYKYRTYLHDNIQFLYRNGFDVDREKFHKKINNVMRLFDLSRCNLCSTNEEIDAVGKLSRIDFDGADVEAVSEMMKWGKANTYEVDYTDMVWLPNALGMVNGSEKYDYVFIDECQDLNIAQMALFKSCINPGGRFVAVGDRNQSIYAFAGADQHSFRKLIEGERTKLLPLSVTYRCPKEIVCIANRMVPSIRVNPANQVVGEVTSNDNFGSITDNSMVLCRNNAPLVDLYIRMLKSGRKSYVKGRDIGRNMIDAIVETGMDDVNADLSREGVMSIIWKDVIDTRNRVGSMYRISEDEALASSVVMHKYDMAKSINVLCAGCSTAKELVERIEGVFADSGDGITLSTVHKSKGLESEDVFLLEPSSIFCDSNGDGSGSWDCEQDKNLAYVAVTRAKRRLGFMTEGVKYNRKSIVSEMKEFLNGIEYRVNRLSGKSNAKLMTDTGFSKVIVDSAPIIKIELPKRIEATKVGGMFSAKSRRN